MSDILIPELSESARTGTVVRINVKPGDKIAKGQTILELETEKAVLEVPSPVDGVVAEILVKPGDKVTVGQAVVRLANGAALAADKTLPTEIKPKMVMEPETKPVPSLHLPTEEPPSSSARTSGAAAGTVSTIVPPADIADVPAAPSVRRLAREIGVSIAEVKGTGPRGRISLDDVKAHAKQILTSRSTGGSFGRVVPAPPLPDFSKWGEITREPMSAIRQKTASHLAWAWSTAAHVTHFAKTDITNVDIFRQRVSTDELKLTITPFMIKLSAIALKNFPKFNASIDVDKKEIIYKKYVNIGCAVDTEHGLLVPVIRDADKKSILAIARELKDLSEKARARKLTLDDMQGGTFTITNLGGITGGHFTPIINVPEVAILGIARAEQEPCFNQGPACSPRLMLPLSLSYDHRLIDGADGARFIKWIGDAIQQPFLLELK